MPTISKLDQALANIDARIQNLQAARAVLVELMAPKEKAPTRRPRAKAPDVPGSQQ